MASPNLNGQLHKRAGDPEIETRIAQYEMAFRMQASVPELADTSKEPDHVYDLYGRRIHASREPSLRTACWLDGWRNATSGSFSSITAAGIITAG